MNKLMRWITTECAWALLAVAINTCADVTPMLINFGAGGEWYEPATSGQGFSFEVVPESNQLVACWFTYPVSGIRPGLKLSAWPRVVTLPGHDEHGGVFFRQPLLVDLESRLDVALFQMGLGEDLYQREES